MDENSVLKASTDIDHLLTMLSKDFPLEFTVAKGGNSIRLKINEGGKYVVLQRDGKWSYE